MKILWFSINNHLMICWLTHIFIVWLVLLLLPRSDWAKDVVVAKIEWENKKIIAMNIVIDADTTDWIILCITYMLDIYAY
jgi:hypothetical protein